MSGSNPTGMDGMTEIDIPQTMRLDEEAAQVETPADPDAPERQVSERDKAMSRIAANREAAIAKELAHGVTMEDEARATGGGEPVEHEGEERPTHTRVERIQASQPQAPQQPQLRRVVVEGQAYNVTQDQYEHLASLGAVASVAMQRQQHEQQQRAAYENQQQQRVAPGHQQPEQQQQPRQGGMDRTRLTDTWRKMSYGSEEEGVAALEELISTVSPQASPQMMANVATQQALQHMQVRDNLATIGREFPDLFGPMDRQHTAEEAELYEIRAQSAALVLDRIRRRDAMLGSQRADLDVYREAALRVRASLGGTQAGNGDGAAQSSAVQAARPQVSTDTDRLERKRAAPRVPQSAGRTAGGAGQERRAPTPSETVAWMASKRGQQTPTRMN